MSDRIFLHFLNREICIASKTGNLPNSYFIEAFSVCSFFSYETMVLSGGHLFEHVAAADIYRIFFATFNRGHVSIVSSADDIEDFVELKRQQYAHTFSQGEYARDYSIYDPKSEWRRIFNGPIEIFRPNYDTTRELSKSMRVSRKEVNISEVDKKVIDILSSRGPRAITIELFRQTGLFSDGDLRRLEAEISETYTRIYQRGLSASIFARSNLVSERFEIGAENSYDYKIYKFLYYFLQINEQFRSSPQETETFRGQYEHIRLVRVLRAFCRPEVSNILQKLEVLFSRAIPDRLRRFNKHFDLADRMDQFSSMVELLVDQGLDRTYSDACKIRFLIGGRVMAINDIFVIHGRDEGARRGLFSLLRAWGLNPLEFEEAVRLTAEERNEPSPYIGDVLDVAMRKAPALIILFSPDEIVTLRESLRSKTRDGEPRACARSNVLFEAGMAFAKYRKQTIIVRVGEVEIPSDLGGRHYISGLASPEKKQQLKSRLSHIGFDISDAKTDWMSIEVNETS